MGDDEFAGGRSHFAAPQIHILVTTMSGTPADDR